MNADFGTVWVVDRNEWVQGVCRDWATVQKIFGSDGWSPVDLDDPEPTQEQAWARFPLVATEWRVSTTTNKESENK